MSNNSIARVRYFEQQFLRTQDFSAEQAYHLAMRRRHHIAHHVWGIVRGLELVEEEGILSVQPGLAIDGYGRELILAHKQPLQLAEFSRKDSDVLDVWLVYNRLGTDQAPPGYASCDPKEQASFYRWQEQPLIRLAVPDPAFRNRRGPESVPEGDLDFAPTRTPPDDPQADWPVFLGQIQRNRPDPSEPYTYSVNLADRPYTGLLGEVIIAPSGRARVQVGAERADDARRFVVFIPDPPVHSEACSDTGEPQPRLEVYASGDLDIRGNTTLHGDLTLAQGAIEFGVGPARSDDTPPWRIYHRVAESESETQTVGDQQNDSQTGGPQPETADHQLCIEMDGGTKGQNQVVIGAWSPDDKAFKPCLEIGDDCSIKIHGNLVVDGHIFETGPRRPATLSPDAQRFGQAALLTGIGGASTLLDKFYRSPFESELDIVARLLDDEQGRQDVADILLEDQNRRDEFLLIVVQRQVGRQAIVNALLVDQSRLVNFMGILLDEDVGRQAVVSSLESNLNRREAFTAQLVGNDAARESVVVALLASTAGRRAIVLGLADSPHLEAFADQLTTNPTTRNAATVSLLKLSDGRQAIVDSLAANLDQLDDFTNRLRGNATTRSAVTASLLEIPDGRQEIVNGLAGSPAELDDFTDRLRGNPTTRSAVTISLLEIADGRQEIVNGLAGQPVHLGDFADRLTANDITRNAVTTSLLQISDGRTSAANGLFDSADGRSALATSMAEEPTRVSDFASLLKDEFPTLAANLRAALAP